VVSVAPEAPGPWPPADAYAVELELTRSARTNGLAAAFVASRVERLPAGVPVIVDFTTPAASELSVWPALDLEPFRLVAERDVFVAVGATADPPRYRYVTATATLALGSDLVEVRPSAAAELVVGHRSFVAEHCAADGELVAVAGGRPAAAGDSVARLLAQHEAVAHADRLGGP
jgi:hypothetical protein